MKPRLILADDHPLLMAGAKQYLEHHGYQVLGTASDGNEAYHTILKYKPEIAILDMDMPVMNGLEVAAQIKTNRIKCKVVILTLYKQEAILKEVGEKIDAYVTKDSALEELDECLRQVADGKNYISPALRGKVKFDPKSEVLELLTPTEIKILRLLKENLTSAEVSEQLFISKRTVEKHRSNIIQKLGLASGHNALFLWLQENGGDL